MAHVLMERLGACDEGEDCQGFQVIRGDGGAGNMIMLQSEGAGGSWVQGDGKMITIDSLGNHVFVTSDDLTLRCPEGDTTTTIKKDLRNQTFLCPQHSVPLEEVKRPAMHRIKIDRLHTDDAADNRKKM